MSALLHMVSSSRSPPAACLGPSSWHNARRETDRPAGVQEGTPPGMKLGEVAEGFATLVSQDGAYRAKATLFKLTLPVKPETQQDSAAAAGQDGQEASEDAVSVGPKQDPGESGDAPAQVSPLNP